MNYERISVAEASSLIGTLESAKPQIADIRDEQAYAAGHIEEAILVNNTNLSGFIEAADLSQPLFVCCYHGNMSQSAAAYFAEQGFEKTYSIDGGYEAWQAMEASQ